MVITKSSGQTSQTNSKPLRFRHVSSPLLPPWSQHFRQDGKISYLHHQIHLFSSSLNLSSNLLLRFLRERERSDYLSALNFFSFAEVMNPFRWFHRLLLSSSPTHRSLSTQASRVNCKSTSRKMKSRTAIGTGGAHRARSLDGVAKGVAVTHLLCKSSAEGGLCHVYLVGTRHMSQVCTGSFFVFFLKLGFLLTEMELKLSLMLDRWWCYFFKLGKLWFVALYLEDYFLFINCNLHL